MHFPDHFLRDIQRAHPSWHATLQQGLQAIERKFPDYLNQLASSRFLPDSHRLFAAFSVPLSSVCYVLIGEGPYPRSESATGYCFMDGAVDGIWSHESAGGLSKPVNRATSLRNFIKMLLVADQRLNAGDTSVAALSLVAQQMRAAPATYVQTMVELQDNFLQHGFLMLNASLVFREDVAPAIDAKVWRTFLPFVFEALATQATKPSFILWGKIADRLDQEVTLFAFEKFKSEHPYNLSFINNVLMHNLFRPLKLLYK